VFKLTRLFYLCNAVFGGYIRLVAPGVFQNWLEEVAEHLAIRRALHSLHDEHFNSGMVVSAALPVVRIFFGESSGEFGPPSKVLGIP
jgi:hypothetical protein